MPRHLQADPNGDGLRIGIALARFNRAVTDRLLAGALEALAAHGVADDAIDVASVPGAFELPIAAARLATGGQFEALACLGAVVKGETPHFDMIAQWVVAELGRLSVQHGIPVALGVLTTNTVEQALARAGGAHGNKGYDAALVAIEMANLVRRLP